MGEAASGRRSLMSICDRNCFACSYKDCICDKMEYQDYQMLDALEKEIIHPKTAQQQRTADRKKAYYEDNKEKIATQMKAYREANREKIKAHKKAYYEANKEKIKAQMKVYYEANKEKIKAYQKAYQKAYRASRKTKKGKGPAGAGTPDKPRTK